MHVRSASLSDLDAVLAIYARARIYMKETGNPSQWGSVYPPRETVESDILSGSLFVAEEASHIYAVFAFFPEGDPLYDSLDGNWLNDLPHAAIHRVASSGERRGMLALCVSHCLSVCKNLKIDTHFDNSVMQHQLKKLGFVSCGTVTLPDGGLRLAFQLYRE